MPFPEFPEPTPMDERRSWTASYQSWDQRLDYLYYAVTVHEDGEPRAPFVAQVAHFWRHESGEATEDIRHQVHRVALDGRPNTDYPGGPPQPND